MSEPPSLPPQSPQPSLAANGPSSVATAASDASSFDQPAQQTPQQQQQQQQVSIEDSDYDRCRIDYVDEIAHLEAEFSRLKSHLFDDRLAFLSAKEQEVLDGRAPEYLEPLAQLTENYRIRVQVAKLTRQLRARSAKRSLECELQWAAAQLEWDLRLLEDRLRAQINQQISNHLAGVRNQHQSNHVGSQNQNHQLQQQRHQEHHQTNGSVPHHHRQLLLQQQQQQQQQNSHQRDHQPLTSPAMGLESPRPVVTSGPVIVYQLTETEIIDDYRTIMSTLNAPLAAPV